MRAPSRLRARLCVYIMYAGGQEGCARVCKMYI